MEQDGGWSTLDYDPDLMTPGAYNLDGSSMDCLSELDDLLSQWTDHDVSVNAPSGYDTTPDPSRVSTSFTVPTAYTPSSAGDSSGQYQHKIHHDEPQEDSLQSQTNSFAFVGSRFSNPPLPPGFQVNLSGSHDADAAEPTVQHLNDEETISPPSARVRPESDSRRTTAPDNVGVSSQGAQSTANDDPLRDALRRVLGQSPSRQRLSQVRQDLGGLCTDLDELLAAQRSVDGMQMAPPPRQPSVNEPKTKHRSKSRVTYRCGMCGVRAATKHVFKRHIETQHYPQYDYHCPFEYCNATSEKPPHRRDKLLQHYTRAHNLDAPSESVIESNRVSHLCPLICALCPRLVQNWVDFYACFVKHCEVKPAPSKASAHRDSHDHGKKRRRDDSDKGNIDSGADNAGFVSQVGHGNSEKSGGPSNPRPSGSGGNQQGRSKQQGRFNQQSRQSRLDLRPLQDQATPQGSRNQCKFCQHAFEACSYCCDSPPSTPWCHACPDAQRALAMQAGVHHAGQLRGILSQPMGVADHIWANRQALNDVNSSIPTMVAVNPSLYGAMPQGAQQLNMHLLQQAPAHGPLSGTVTQQRPFASDLSWTVGALHDIQVAGMSELEIEHSISGSKKKKAQSSNIWSDALPFRDSPLPAHQPPTGVNMVPQVFIGPLSLNKVSFSSMCQYPCRTRSQGTYFARTRVDIALGRMIQMDFKMAPESRGLGHPLRTRIQVVVKMLGLRFSVAKLVTGKHKQEAHAVLKQALEAPLNCSESKAINSAESVIVVDPDSTDYESDAESVTDSIFSVRSRVSSCNDLTLFSPGPSSPALKSSGIPSCTGLKLPVPARTSSPLCRDSDDDTNNDEQPFEEEEKDLELTFDLDLLSSLNTLSRWAGVPSGNLSSDLSVQDPDRIFEYFMRYILFVIVSLAHARDCTPNPCLAKRRPPQP